jgi:hypothetical protein
MTIIPDFILKESRLNSDQKLILARMYTICYTDEKGAINPPKLAEWLGISTNAVNNSIVLLSELGILLEYFPESDSAVLKVPKGKIRKQRITDKSIAHSDKLIADQTDIKIELSKAECEALVRDFDCKEEVRYWVDRRIEWLIATPSEASRGTRNDYIAIRKWRDAELAKGSAFSNLAGDKPGYIPNWRVKQELGANARG